MTTLATSDAEMRASLLAASRCQQMVMGKTYLRPLTVAPR